MLLHACLLPTTLCDPPRSGPVLQILVSDLPVFMSGFGRSWKRMAKPARPMCGMELIDAMGESERLREASMHMKTGAEFLGQEKNSTDVDFGPERGRSNHKSTHAIRCTPPFSLSLSYTHTSALKIDFLPLSTLLSVVPPSLVYKSFLFVMMELLRLFPRSLSRSRALYYVQHTPALQVSCSIKHYNL